LAIDGRPSADLDLPEIRRALSVDGASREVRLLRGADTVVSKVTLRPLF